MKVMKCGGNRRRGQQKAASRACGSERRNHKMYNCTHPVKAAVIKASKRLPVLVLSKHLFGLVWFGGPHPPTPPAPPRTFRLIE